MIQTSKSTLISLINICIFTLFLLPIRCFCSIDPYYEACVPKDCGNGHNISYPFYIHGQQESYCGYPGFELNCTSNGFPLLHIPDNDYVVQQIHYGNQSIRVSNAAAVLNNSENGCFPLIRNVTLERNSVFRMGNYSTNLVFLSDCNQELDLMLRGYGVGCGGGGGGGEGLVMLESDVNLGLGKEECGENVVAPVELDGGGSDGIGNGSWSYYEELLRKGFLMKWTAGDCSICADSGGRCGFNQSSFHFRCFCPDRPHAWRCRTKKGKKKVVIAVVAIGSAFILVICLAFMIRRLCKWSKIPSYFSSRKSTKDLEAASVYFRVPIFSYKELEEATHSFDANRELGDGGFGAVFYGKLKDGREVAVKRLYEHNYKRVEQFMNEVEILTRLRHPNLVLLYGCTSHRSRELLLVYEYIPNGTVADHLHGDRAKPALLTWAIRMNIAIETASALAYLHKSDIIHRDVKSNNILLDENFSVKVADFGLSRLFPTDVTHVSTAPQGTPGYVDPEYHQCYQLTDKSDVYSFGVVLVELISSMPAVDISRHRHEINLSNFALNRIQKCEFNELIDPNIGFGSDERVNRMTTSVAELAFRCLQFDKEMRPTMDEALVVLKEIHGIEIKEGAHSNGQVKCVKPPPSPETEEARLLKDSSKFPPPSPISVTGNWHSGSSTTPYTSS